MYRGSRKHVLDWTTRPSFLDEFAELLSPVPVEFPSESVFMPRGEREPDEARLEIHGPLLRPGGTAWSELEEWWLARTAGANTPNWDIAAGCVIEGAPGLALVEAKANWPELGSGGKPLAADASARSRENHQRIGAAIDEARDGWRVFEPGVSISRDSHYQLANRLAFTWKLATLGIPVVLVYLGFTGDGGIIDAGPPFTDNADWQRAFHQYAHEVAPPALWERRVGIGPAPAWLLSRSRPVIEPSPARSS